MSEEKKLHLGPGKVYLPGWLNVDVFSNIKADAYHDVTNLPYEKGTFDKIYVCHLLEHVHRHMVLATLNHWVSLLKKGGTLRLAVPNFSAICDYYTQTDDLDSVMGLLYGGQDNFLNRHTVTFDQVTLSRDMRKAGLKNIVQWDWRKTEHADHDDYSQAYLGGDHPIDKVKGVHVSLNLEGVKG